ncbi:hypothetical protein [Halobaculum lipolyticum]|uniref:DUF1102 domain-containing protein n=1 Tax=Halobaculum lipolyticum TaxID=3032001 RepID=A0ABD5W7Q0_9EURY|nr:hypothetical protein [Halobaculum sp. DT31]
MAGPALRLALLVVVATGLAVGSSGFGAVEADRSVDVAVVGDDEAYVGVVACQKGNDGAGSGKQSVRVRVDNRYTEAVTVVGIASDDAERTDGSASAAGSVGVGDRERFEVVFADDVATLTVDVAAGGFDASVTRPVAAKTECPIANRGGNGRPPTDSGGNAST